MLLKAEYIAAERRLKACKRELEAILLEMLKDETDAFCNDFCQVLNNLIQVSFIALAGLNGKALEQDNLATRYFAGKCMPCSCFSGFLFEWALNIDVCGKHRCARMPNVCL